MPSLLWLLVVGWKAVLKLGSAFSAPPAGNPTPPRSSSSDSIVLLVLEAVVLSYRVCLTFGLGRLIFGFNGQILMALTEM